MAYVRSRIPTDAKIVCRLSTVVRIEGVDTSPDSGTDRTRGGQVKCEIATTNRLSEGAQPG